MKALLGDTNWMRLAVSAARKASSVALPGVVGTAAAGGGCAVGTAAAGGGCAVGTAADAVISGQREALERIPHPLRFRGAGTLLLHLAVQARNVDCHQLVDEVQGIGMGTATS